MGLTADEVASHLDERVLPVLSYEDCTSSLESYFVPSAQSTIPATLIGNWEIAGIRSGDVSQSQNITVIGHLKLPERKVTFGLVRRTFGEMFYVTMRNHCDSSKRESSEIDSSK